MPLAYFIVELGSSKFRRYWHFWPFLVIFKGGFESIPEKHRSYDSLCSEHSLWRIRQRKPHAFRPFARRARSPEAWSCFCNYGSILDAFDGVQKIFLIVLAREICCVPSTPHGGSANANPMPLASFLVELGPPKLVQARGHHGSVLSLCHRTSNLFLMSSAHKSWSAPSTHHEGLTTANRMFLALFLVELGQSKLANLCS